VDSTYRENSDDVSHSLASPSYDRSHFHAHKLHRREGVLKMRKDLLSRGRLSKALARGMSR